MEHTSKTEEALSDYNKAEQLSDLCNINRVPNREYIYVCYNLTNNDEQAANRLSKINEDIVSKFAPKVLANGSAAYYNRVLYPLVNQFERLLRKYLHVRNIQVENETVKGLLDHIEKKDFGNIADLLFVDKQLLDEVKKITKDVKNKQQIIDQISELNERTIWSIFDSGNELQQISDNFYMIKEYRNDVMHAHNINESTFKAAKKLFKGVNAMLDNKTTQLLEDCVPLVLASDDVNNIEMQVKLYMEKVMPLIQYCNTVLANTGVDPEVVEGLIELNESVQALKDTIVECTEALYENNGE